jgi:hypothetical protein
MHNFLLITGLLLVLLACITSSWATVTQEINIGKTNISDTQNIGLWNKCWSADYNDGKLDIISKCKSNSDMPNINKNDIYIVRILSILSIIFAVVALVEASVSRISEKIVAILAGISTIFSITTLVYFSLRIKNKIDNSSLGLSFYIQIIGTILLALGTLFHTKLHNESDQFH